MLAVVRSSAGFLTAVGVVLLGLTAAAYVLRSALVVAFRAEHMPRAESWVDVEWIWFPLAAVVVGLALYMGPVLGVGLVASVALFGLAGRSRRPGLVGVPMPDPGLFFGPAPTNPSTGRVEHAPDWYDDPRDGALERWFDGRGWTSHTVEKARWEGLVIPPPPREDMNDTRRFVSGLPAWMYPALIGTELVIAAIAVLVTHL